MTPIYFTTHPTDGSIIAIKHGTTGYHTTDLGTDIEQANRLNAMSGHTAGQIKAAVTCSMSGNWDRFDTLVEAHQ